MTIDDIYHWIQILISLGTLIGSIIYWKKRLARDENKKKVT
jgi:hypothetical protein